MSHSVDRFVLGAEAANCYVLRAHRGTSDAVVVDPGDAAADLRLELARIGARCTAILLTHTHWDHIRAVADLAEGTGAPVYVPELERPVLERPDDFFGPFGVHVRPHSAEETLVGGERLKLAGLALDVLPVPGHSPGHLAFVGDGRLLSGDVLFQG